MSDLDPVHPKGKALVTGMPPIDLTLAVNYIPAAVCLAKAALISFCLSIVQPWHHLGGFIIIAMLLNIDRAVACGRIFDENAVQLAILAAWIINILRVSLETTKFIQFLNVAASVAWMTLSLALVFEPRVVREFLVLYGQGSGSTMHKLLPAVLTGLMVSSICFTPIAEESAGVKSVRAMGFATLCVLWVYVVSVWRRTKRQTGVCVFETHALISRFCLVLYVHHVLAFWFMVVCLGCILYHYVRIHVAETVVTEQEVASVASMWVPEIIKEDNEYKTTKENSAIRMTDLQLSKSNLEEMSTIDEEDDEAMEAYFRSACQNSQARQSDLV